LVFTNFSHCCFFYSCCSFHFLVFDQLISMQEKEERVSELFGCEEEKFRIRNLFLECHSNMTEMDNFEKCFVFFRFLYISTFRMKFNFFWLWVNKAGGSEWKRSTKIQFEYHELPFAAWSLLKINRKDEKNGRILFMCNGIVEFRASWDWIFYT
jgi:hypothetical protein